MNRRYTNGESTKAAAAFVQGKPFKGKLTEVETHVDGWGMFLHKHCIAAHRDGMVTFCMHGWTSQTTIARLNAICAQLWGKTCFRQEKGRVWFGHGFLREVDPNEKIRLPMEVTP
jgi:hypothetical protein